MIDEREGFVRCVWAGIVSEDDTGWVDKIAASARADDDSPCGDLGTITKAMLEAGITREQIARFARIMQYDLAFGLCYMLDDPTGLISDFAIETTGNWALFRIDQDGNPLEPMYCLHEDLLGRDPTGRQMQPKHIKEGIDLSGEDEMSIWLWRANSNRFRAMDLCNERDQAVINRFSGQPFGSSWQPVRVRLLTDEEEGQTGMPTGDCPNLESQVPVLSQRAVDALGALLTDNGEVLPLSCDEGSYYAYNVTRVIDALDKERSKIVYFDDGQVLDIDHHVFDLTHLRGVTVFKVPETAGSDVFVTTAFVRAVQEAGLTGFKFVKLPRKPHDS
jgi:hypothetical protein